MRLIIAFVLMLLSLVANASSNMIPANLILEEPVDMVSSACGAIDFNFHETSDSRSVHLRRVFLDEFHGPTLSNSWRTFYNEDAKAFSGRSIPSNSEKEIYVDPAYAGKSTQPLGLNPFHFGDDMLRIMENRTPSALLDQLYGLPFTSGVINSNASYRYGYFEIRARLPRGKGLWPAFWMIGQGWPPEIDVLEAMNGDRPDIVSLSTHWSEAGLHRSTTCNIMVTDDDKEFRTYGVLWTPERLVYFLDHKAVIEMATPLGLDKPMHMLANLGVESIADDSTPSASYDIKWIAVYELDHQ